jgi:hypothetical protein
MTNLINQISINGETTTFLNYIDPVVKGEVPGRAGITQLLTAHFGDDRTKWTQDGGDYAWAIRWPVPWETKTGTIAAPSRAGFAGVDGVGNARSVLAPYYVTTTARIGTGNGINASYITTSTSSWGNYANAPSSYQMIFGVVNNYSICIKAFANNQVDTSEPYTMGYQGWLKEGVYSGLQYPRNYVFWDLTASQRVAQENLTTATNVSRQNPTLSCSVATPSANSTDVIIRDSTAPNNYIGKLWNMMILPSTAVVGKIYRNTGIDPDTGQVETDQKAYWMCVGTWGTDKIGMRVWTDNLI